MGKHSGFKGRGLAPLPLRPSPQLYYGHCQVVP